MSESKLFDDDLVRDYLNKRLSPEEEIHFETEMLACPSKTEQVVLTDSLKSGVTSVPAVSTMKNGRVKRSAVALSAIAAGIVAWLWLPALLVKQETVSPGIVYLEDFRSHTTEAVNLNFARDEAFKVVVSDAPPTLRDTISAKLISDSSQLVSEIRIKPNSNNEVSLIIDRDMVDSGLYTLIFTANSKEINRFELKVTRE
ncbi:hypothetical protein [Aestuariibacter sp. A3R04]|uniref:hypothetical protein n=1 Tax=Aestuariibacter sp. A3R04 TaxID=2841571 RepID=UPI001C09440F|nr:hypothetical protein [Aestuariibacter sp. A3R04]MBU3020914.1 hypothetical protein [Aestuariibacter sp. A3R04]